MRHGSNPHALAQRLVVLCVAGGLLFDFPLLKLLLGSGGTVFGLPRGPFALFAVWALLIVVLAWWMERDDDAGTLADGRAVAPPAKASADGR